MSIKMKDYEVRVVFKYSDTVRVKAKNEDAAISAAVQESEEEYECFYDAHVARA